MAGVGAGAAAAAAAVAAAAAAAGMGHARLPARRRRRKPLSSSVSCCTTSHPAVSLTHASPNDNLEQSRPVRRRDVFALVAATAAAGLVVDMGLASAALADPVVIRPETAPKGVFDAKDPQLREAAALFQEALDAMDVEDEEKLWTLLIDRYSNVESEWATDIVSRAWGNRGNARSRQGKLLEALSDYNKSIELTPYAVDPVLNRGVVLEALGEYEQAVADYEAVLKVAPNDPAAWNNLGNAKAGLGQWDDAVTGYSKAAQLAPEFAFAAANHALALYQIGKKDEAFRMFRNILRKYPEFPDIRAALAAALYAEGKGDEAETNWLRVEDLRYKDRQWVEKTRRWPPRLVAALASFLDLTRFSSSNTLKAEAPEPTSQATS
eukprot:jgi/Chlat1/5613/Chrsp369S00863